MKEIGNILEYIYADKDESDFQFYIRIKEILDKAIYICKQDYNERLLEFLLDSSI